MSKDFHNKMAQYAFTKVSGIGSKDKEFRSLARTMPSLIQVNGLGAAVALLYSKKNNRSAHDKMYDLLNDWYKSEVCQLSGKQGDLIDCIVSLDSGTYRQYMNEIMSLSMWIKRFAEGMIDGGQE